MLPVGFRTRRISISRTVMKIRYAIMGLPCASRAAWMTAPAAGLRSASSPCSNGSTSSSVQASLNDAPAASEPMGASYERLELNGGSR